MLLSLSLSLGTCNTPSDQRSKEPTTAPAPLPQLLIEIRLSLIALNGGATEMWVTSHVVVVVATLAVAVVVAWLTALRTCCDYYFHAL